MNEEDRRERLQAYYVAEMERSRHLPRVWWRIAFFVRNGDEPEFLGSTAIKARCGVEAVQLTHKLGINPGGEVVFEQSEYQGDPPDELRNKLVTDIDRAMELGEEWERLCLS